MKSMRQASLVLALAGAVSVPALSMAADAARSEHDSHHAGQVQAAAPAVATGQGQMQAMRERMMAIRAEKDPAKRKALMEAQMRDMEAMLNNPPCPMASAQGGGMMPSGMGMGMMGGGMQGNQSGMDGMMARRMDMMQQRMDMMQQRLDMMQKGTGMQGGGMDMPAK